MSGLGAGLTGQAATSGGFASTLGNMLGQFGAGAITNSAMGGGGGGSIARPMSSPASGGGGPNFSSDFGLDFDSLKREPAANPITTRPPGTEAPIISDRQLEDLTGKPGDGALSGMQSVMPGDQPVPTQTDDFWKNAKRFAFGAAKTVLDDAANAKPWVQYAPMPGPAQAPGGPFSIFQIAASGR